MNGERMWAKHYFQGFVGVCILTVFAQVVYAAPKDLLVSTTATNSVRRYDGVTGAFVSDFVAPGSGGLNQPTGLTIGPDGKLYVTSSGNGNILRYNGQTGAFIDVFANTGLNGLWDLTFGPDGNLYVVNRRLTVQPSTAEGVYRFNGTTGAPLGQLFTTHPPQFGGHADPFAMLFQPDGNILVCINGFDDLVKRFNGATGAFIDVFVPHGSAGLDNPFDIAFGPDGDLYVSSNGLSGGSPGAVLRYNKTTGAFVSAFVSGGSGGLINPFGITFGPDGNLYVNDENTGNILRYNGATGAFLGVFVAVNSAPFINSPRYMVFADFGVVDNVPPTIGNLQANPSTLWPPNHKMVDVSVTATVTDNVDPTPTFKITGVSSNEPDNGLGDGDASPDFVITGNTTIQLRAERSGTGTGRTYTITVEAKDVSGNTSTATVAVTVPKSQGK